MSAVHISSYWKRGVSAVLKTDRPSASFFSRAATNDEHTIEIRGKWNRLIDIGAAGYAVLIFLDDELSAITPVEVTAALGIWKNAIDIRLGLVAGRLVDPGIDTNVSFKARALSPSVVMRPWDALEASPYLARMVVGQGEACSLFLEWCQQRGLMGTWRHVYESWGLDAMPSRPREVTIHGRSEEYR